MALSWKVPQSVRTTFQDDLKQVYHSELELLRDALPSRFLPSVQSCIDHLRDIMSLPMVLSHSDLSSSNIMVDETTCHLNSVLDWAEAEVCPFGLNLQCIEGVTGKLHLRDGWIRYEDYDTLQQTFWDRFLTEVGGLSTQEIRVIKLASVLGVLLFYGLDSGTPYQTARVPIRDDEVGRYRMLSLDGFLINPGTRFDVVS